MSIYMPYRPAPYLEISRIIALNNLWLFIYRLAYLL